MYEMQYRGNGEVCGFGICCQHPHVAIVFTSIHMLGVECDRGFDGLPVWRWGLVDGFAQRESVETFSQ